MISVIVPAHNKQHVIARCLAALFDGARPDELDVIVVCNGCTDKTAAVAQSFADSGRPVRVIQTQIASKVHALNVGDAAARAFPRFVVDADVLVSGATLKRLAAVLEEGSVLAVAPRCCMDTTRSSWAVRAFWQIADLLPSAREGIGGSGVYGLSQAGRRRFAEFPTVTADDGFVRIQFQPHERRTVQDCRSIVVASRTLADLLAITTRAHFGTAELRLRFPGLFANRGPTNHAALLALWARPWLWPQLTVYTVVKLVARWRSLRKLRATMHSACAQPPATAWERDDAARASPGSVAAVPAHE